MIRIDMIHRGGPNPPVRPFSWRRALIGGLMALSLTTAIACGSTADSEGTVQPDDAAQSETFSRDGDPTRPAATTGGVIATDTPNAAALATRTPFATATRVASPTRVSSAPTPTIRIAPTPTRILRVTSTPFVPATRSFFATATPTPRIRSTVVRPTATRFPAPTATPFTGGGSSSGSSGGPTPHTRSACGRRGQSFADPELCAGELHYLRRHDRDLDQPGQRLAHHHFGIFAHLRWCFRQFNVEPERHIQPHFQQPCRFPILVPHSPGHDDRDHNGPVAARTSVKLTARAAFRVYFGGVPESGSPWVSFGTTHEETPDPNTSLPRSRHDSSHLYRR